MAMECNWLNADKQHDMTRTLVAIFYCGMRYKQRNAHSYLDDFLEDSTFNDEKTYAPRAKRITLTWIAGLAVSRQHSQSPGELGHRTLSSWWVLPGELCARDPI